MSTKRSSQFILVEILYDTHHTIASFDDYERKYQTLRVGTNGISKQPVMIWGWEEDKNFVSNHHSSDLIQGTNFVKYPLNVSDDIEKKYNKWMKDKRLSSTPVLDMTGKTVKSRNPHTGLVYRIDFKSMKQVNMNSKFSRNVRRVVHDASGEPGQLPPLPRTGMRTNQDSFLPTKAGQVLLVEKTSLKRQWLYGHDVSDPKQKGWFPAIFSKDIILHSATKKPQHNILAIPESWDLNKDGPLVKVPVATQEYTELVGCFTSSIHNPRTILSIERIQNKELWESYVVKSNAIHRKYKNDNVSLKNNKIDQIEKTWLFHGTDADTIRKILNTGFNRSFAGRNNTCFGKGVYFARNASYSEQFAVPDTQGVRWMLFMPGYSGRLARWDNRYEDSGLGL